MNSHRRAHSTLRRHRVAMAAGVLAVVTGTAILVTAPAQSDDVAPDEALAVCGPDTVTPDRAVVPGPDGHSVSGGTATFVVPDEACLQLTLASYALPGGSVLPYEEQVLYEAFTGYFGPGTAQRRGGAASLLVADGPVLRRRARTAAPRRSRTDPRPGRRARLGRARRGVGPRRGHTLPAVLPARRPAVRRRRVRSRARQQHGCERRHLRGRDPLGGRSRRRRGRGRTRSTPARQSHPCPRTARRRSR